VKIIRNERGFTLIELMVVVIIIGILAAVAVPAMNKQTDKAKIKRAVSELKTMKTVIDTYYAEHGTVPKASIATTDSANVGYVLQQAGIKFTGASGGLMDPWNHAYIYSVDSDTNLNAYKVICKGPDGTINSGADDIYIDKDHNPTEGSNQDNLPGTSVSSGI